MGYRIIILILVFLILIGGIFIILGRKQVDAKEGLAESIFVTQARQVANDNIMSTARDLKQSLTDGNGVPLPYTGTQGIYNIQIVVFADEYEGNPLTEDTYYIASVVRAHADDGTVYIVRSNALYEHMEETVTPPDSPTTYSDGLNLKAWEEKPVEIIMPEPVE